MSPLNVNRRNFLRGAGVALALPWLESLSVASAQKNIEDVPPRRMLLISNNLGVLPTPFFPTTTGKNYKLSPYLENLSAFRESFTILSGLSHPDVEGGHSTENCFLTAARGPTQSGFRNSISLDQFACEHLGPVTRFPTLNLGVNIDKANRSLSWTRDGALLPAEDRASTVFQKMFVQGDDASIAKNMSRLDEQTSILDTLLDDARHYQKSLGREDRPRLSQYLNSIREVEKRIQAARQWESTKKPETDEDTVEEIVDRAKFIEKFDLMLSLAQLAFESDSTRIVTLMVDAFATPAFRLSSNENTTDGYHNLSHHGQSSSKLQQLQDVDHRQMKLLHKLFSNLLTHQQGPTNLLEQTAVLFGSNMGNSNTHENTNLPVLLAGGGFKHGQHLAFPRDRNRPLCDLFVTILQQLGIETDDFGSSTGNLNELVG